MAEKIRLKSSRGNFKSTLSLFLGIKTLIDNRDVGDIVALTVPEAVKAQPHTIRLEVFFYSVKQPPYSRRTANQRLVRATCTIPDVKRSSLKWETIKTACGGVNGYTWGRFLATAWLDNNRQMQVYGGSAQEAEQRLKALQELSSTKILTLSVTEEKKEGKRASGELLYKESTRVYPAYFCVINIEKIQVENKAEFESLPKNVPTTKSLTGVKRRRTTEKIPLWVEKEPSTANKIIQEALKVKKED
jgi:hypothetical protein